MPGEPAEGCTRTAALDSLFAAVPEDVWIDRTAALNDADLQAIRERIEGAALTPDDLDRERARLETWLDSHRAETIADLVGGWHGLRRLVDRDVQREYETNRRKRKLLDQLLASAAE